MRKSTMKHRYFLAMSLAVSLAMNLALMPASQAADNTVKRYTIESGEIQYQISGTGKMMGATILTTGNKKLVFKNYGTLQLEEEQIQEITTGADNRTINKHTLSKLDNITVYEVDFKHKNIKKTTDMLAVTAMGKNMGEDTAKTLQGLGGEKLQQTDNVQGYACNVWTLMGAKQCLYKDQVPLWIETSMMGIKQKTTAVSIKFNHAISDNQFALPDYPVQDMSMSDKDIQQAIEMSKIMQQSQANLKQEMKKQGKTINQASEADAQKAMAAAMEKSKPIQDQLTKMKSDMPKMLTLVKEYRACLQKADNKSAAQRCQENAKAKEKNLGLTMDDDEDDGEDDLGSWSAAEKKAYLKEMDEGVAEMEKALPCIQNATNMMDLMGCYQR